MARLHLERAPVETDGVGMPAGATEEVRVVRQQVGIARGERQCRTECGERSGIVAERLVAERQHVVRIARCRRQCRHRTRDGECIGRPPALEQAERLGEARGVLRLHPDGRYFNLCTLYIQVRPSTYRR